MNAERIDLDQSGFGNLISETALATSRKALDLSLTVDPRFQEPNAPCHAVHAITTIDDAKEKLRFTMSANVKVLHHIADAMLGEPVVDSEDYEDAVKEFFNIICGRIVSEIVKKYKVSIVFPPPVFSSAYVAPQKSIAHMSFSVNGLGERLCFICDLRS